MEERTFLLGIGGLAETEAAMEFIEGAASKSLPCGKLTPLLIACEEWFVNCCKHGRLSGGDGDVNISVRREGDSLYVEFADSGEPFDPTCHPAPDTSVPLEDKRPGGLGIHLMKKLADGISWRREGHRNVLTIMMRLSGA
jgi:anti-sigma regulatory factor (Ser/Thr protein kinase)